MPQPADTPTLANGLRLVIALLIVGLAHRRVRFERDKGPDALVWAEEVMIGPVAASACQRRSSPSLCRGQEPNARSDANLIIHPDILYAEPAGSNDSYPPVSDNSAQG